MVNSLLQRVIFVIVAIISVANANTMLTRQVVAKCFVGSFTVEPGNQSLIRDDVDEMLRVVT